MVIYILVVLFSLVILLFNKKSNDKMSFIIFIILTILSAIRSYKVGADTLQFWNIYRYIGIISKSEILNLRFEIGYLLLLRILRTITTNPQILLVVTSIFTNFVIYRFISKYSKNTILSTILYITLNFYFSFICLMRQGLALSIILLGYDYLIQKKYLKFSIFCIIGTLFHSSAIFLLILVPLSMMKNKNILFNTIILSAISLFLSKFLFLVVANNFGDYSKYLSSTYAESSYITAPLYTLINYLMLCFGFMLVNKDIKENILMKEKKFVMLSLILSFGTIVSSASIEISIFNRFFTYFNFFSIIWVPNCLELIENKKNKQILTLLFIIFSIMYVSTITYMGWYGVYPYSFCWEVPALM